jgi:hypothetical protein
MVAAVGGVLVWGVRAQKPLLQHFGRMTKACAPSYRVFIGGLRRGWGEGGAEWRFFDLRWPLIREKRWCKVGRRVGRMKQIIRELKRHVEGEKLEPEQLRALIRAGYVYRNGDEHLLTDMGREALGQPGVYPRVEH